MYSQEDLKTFASRGVTEEKINEQLPAGTPAFGGNSAQMRQGAFT